MGNKIETPMEIIAVIAPETKYSKVGDNSQSGQPNCEPHIIKNMSKLPKAPDVPPARPITRFSARHNFKI